MNARDLVIAVNPGSTSTKTAIYKKELCVKYKNLIHSADEIKCFISITDQFEFRMDKVVNWLEYEKIKYEQLIAAVGRGGIIRPVPGGTYIVTDRMIEDLKSKKRVQHASNLGAMIAKGIAESEGIPAFIVDPVSIDEFDDLARISGLPELPIRSLVHALNIKAVSRRAANQMGKEISGTNFIVAHLGGGITVSPVKDGRIIDANVATDGGPFSPERMGGVPTGDLIKLAYSGKYSKEELIEKTIGNGGLIAYLSTNDCKEVEKRIGSGDSEAKLVFEAMCYQISKEITAMATVLYGKVDAIILTGGLSYSKRLVKFITKMVGFIAHVIVIPGEDEMLALVQGANRVIDGVEKAKIYEDEVLD